MSELKDKIISIADENGWSTYIEDEAKDYVIFGFEKYSPAGQDFHISAEIEDKNPESLLMSILATYNNFDVSYESYLWLGSDGHGKNGAPCDMKDVYEDMEACQEMILELYNAFRNVDWGECCEEICDDTRTTAK